MECGGPHTEIGFLLGLWDADYKISGQDQVDREKAVG